MMVKVLILKDLMEKMRYSVNEFEREIDVKKGRIYKGIERKSELKLDVVEKIITRFPEVNREWLLTGKGEMLLPVTNTTTISTPRRDAKLLGGFNEDDAVEFTKSGNKYIDLGGSSYVMITKLVEQRAYGGYLVGYKDVEYVEKMPEHAVTVNQIPRGKYTSFEMANDSMDDGSENAIKEGDIITGRYIDPSLYLKSKLHLRKFKEWIIVHTEGIIVKEIIEHDVEKGIIIIHSYNPDKLHYPDETIYLKDVREMHNVVIVTKKRK